MHVTRFVCWAALGLALFPAAASAADQVVWTTYMSGGKIRAGDGGVLKRDISPSEASPEGVAIDAAAGKVYWASTVGDAIRVANLDGTGARNLFSGEDGATGIVLDAADGRLYWTDYNAGTVRTGKTDGTGAVNLATGESEVSGIAFDKAAGKLYWGQYAPGKVRVLRLGTGGPTNAFNSSEPYVTGVAVDSATGTLYWTNEFAGKIRVGNPNGGVAQDLIPAAGSVGGIAIDPEAGKLYWAAYDLGAIRTANLNGTGPITNIVTGETNAFYVALLRAPAPVTGPRVTGDTAVGATLTCQPGSWATDILGGHVYRAPASLGYSWRKDGVVIGGAVTPVYTAYAPGSYSCVETATNGAGPTAQTSAEHAIVAPPAPGGGGGPTTPPPPAKLKALKAGYDIYFSFKHGRNVPTRFKFSQLPRAAAVTVGCHGKGCPFKSKSAKVKGSKANLLSVVKRARLAKGAYLEVKTTAPGYVTEVLRFIAIGRSGARLQRLCLPAGAKKPQKC
jgi:hypothetical protein